MLNPKIMKRIKIICRGYYPKGKRSLSHLLWSPNLVPRPYFQLVRETCINCDSMGVVMEVHNIPLARVAARCECLRRYLS
jgi:hypothetical protein